MTIQTTKSVVAKLTLEVEYDDFPDIAELRQLVEDARGWGHVVKAVFVVHKGTEVDLL